MAQRIYLVTIYWPDGKEVYPFATEFDADSWVTDLLADPGLQGLADGMVEFDRAGVLVGREANDDRFWAKIAKEIQDEQEGMPGEPSEFEDSLRRGVTWPSEGERGVTLDREEPFEQY